MGDLVWDMARDRWWGCDREIMEIGGEAREMKLGAWQGNQIGGGGGGVAQKIILW